MDSEKIKHIELIQSIITRMNTNSFQIKGLTITLVAAIMAVQVSTSNKLLILIPIVPIIILWFLDAYYLTLERRFRRLYIDVTNLSENNTTINPFDLNLKNYKNGKCRYIRVIFSKTVWPIYIPLITLLVVLYFFSL